MALLQEEGDDTTPVTMLQEDDNDEAVYTVPNSDPSTMRCVAYSVVNSAGYENVH